MCDTSAGFCVSREEGRFLRLLLSAIFFAQAVIETALHDYDTRRVCWLWISAAATFVGLWLLEVCILILVDIACPPLPFYEFPSPSNHQHHTMAAMATDYVVSMPLPPPPQPDPIPLPPPQSLDSYYHHHQPPPITTNTHYLQRPAPITVTSAAPIRHLRVQSSSSSSDSLSNRLRSPTQQPHTTTMKTPPPRRIPVSYNTGSVYDYYGTHYA